MRAFKKFVDTMMMLKFERFSRRSFKVKLAGLDDESHIHTKED